MEPIEIDTPNGLLSEGMKHKSLSFKMIRGVVFSVARKLVAGPIFLLIVPFILHKVGAAEYGVWAILGAVMNICTVLDLGLSATITKYIAEHNGTGDLNQLRRVADATLALYLAIAAVVVGGLALGSHAIVREFFQGSFASAGSQVLPLWPLLLITVGADVLARPFGAMIGGLQRLDINNVLLFVHTLSNAILTVIFLLAGAKLKGLLLAACITALLHLVGVVVASRWLLPSVGPNPFRCKFGVLKTICSFSTLLSAGYVITMIQGQFEKLYLARYAGVVAAGWYNMATEAASKVRRMPDLLLSPIMIAASELDAANERDKMRQLYFRSHKYLAVTSVPLVIFALLTAKTLVRLWVGPGLTQIALPFAGLVLGNFFMQVGGPTDAVLIGRGILRPAVYTALVAGVLNIVLSYIFISRWGFSGAMLGTALPMIISTVYFFISFRRYLDIPTGEILRRAYLKPFLCSAAAAAAMWTTTMLPMPEWQRFIAMIIVYAAVYVVGIVASRFFDTFDFEKMEGHLPFVRSARRIILVS